MNNGAQQLVATGAQTKTIADICEVKSPLVSAWKGGKKLPAYPMRERLRDSYGIPLDAWDRAPIDRDTKPENVPIAPSIESAPRFERHLAELDAALADKAITLPLRVQLLRARTDALKVQAIREEKREEQEARMLTAPPRRYPWVARTLEAIRAALKPHPEARAAVERALEQLESPSADGEDDEP